MCVRDVFEMEKLVGISLWISWSTSL